MIMPVCVTLRVWIHLVRSKFNIDYPLYMYGFIYMDECMCAHAFIICHMYTLPVDKRLCVNKLSLTAYNTTDDATNQNAFVAAL